jgi:hypothetical protein
MTRSSLPRAQRGASALVALVFLVIVAFVVLTAYRLSGQQLMLAGNAQSRAQALAATNFAVERTISTVDFLRTPAVVAATPIGVDIDGNGGDDLNVTLGMPVCYRLRIVPQAELDERRAGDVGCIGGSAPAGSVLVINGSGATAGTSGESQCADSEWSLSATYADPVTGSALTVNQGVGVRADRIDAANNCS